MNIMELAAQLGKKIKEDVKVQQYYAASEAYENDTQLQVLIQEYNTQRMAMEEELKKADPDNEFVEVIENRIEEIYNNVVENPVYLAFADAQDELNQLMHMVNDEITFQVTGERHCSHNDSCGDGCDSCSGCH